jgi:hypothetical protein
MVTHHEFGERFHNREVYYVERRVVETPPDLAETVRTLMVELQSFKVENESDADPHYPLGPIDLLV